MEILLVILWFEGLVEEFYAFKLRRIVDVAEVIACIFIEFQIGGITDLLEQHVARIVLTDIGCVVECTAERVAIAEGVGRDVEGHAVHRDLMGNGCGTMFLGVVAGFACATFFEGFLTGSEQCYQRDKGEYLLHVMYRTNINGA